MQVVALTPRYAGAWAELFDACGSSCFCRYWHFAGGKNDWLARCAHDPTANRREQLASIAEGDAAARGLLALDGDLAVGWMKLVPRACATKLTSLPVYRSVPAEEGVHVIGCLLVRPRHRRRGVARALVAAADAHVLEWGGRAIEAYPRHSEAPLHDEEAWMGPEKVFVEGGYAAVGGEVPYRVYRKALEASHLTPLAPRSVNGAGGT